MPDWLIIVLAVLVLLVVALAVAGDVWNRRHRARTATDLLERVRGADRALADAAADDHGWDRAALEDAARAAFAVRHPELSGRDPVLVLVDDRPGTDADRAVFEVSDGTGTHAVTLLRTGDVWVAEPSA